ncbi:MAG: hypothetical protein NTV56_00330, partial [Alphaproteobacteria bacterium]|nr:hypothetical protein [Alphaproteobacteria bacterium]
MMQQQKDRWDALLSMQKLIDRGFRPNAAAVQIANSRWASISKTPEAATQWLKRNQREFKPDLQATIKSQSHISTWTSVSRSAPLHSLIPAKFF